METRDRVKCLWEGEAEGEAEGGGRAGDFPRAGAGESDALKASLSTRLFIICDYSLLPPCLSLPVSPPPSAPLPRLPMLMETLMEPIGFSLLLALDHFVVAFGLTADCCHPIGDHLFIFLGQNNNYYNKYHINHVNE